MNKIRAKWPSLPSGLSGPSTEYSVLSSAPHMSKQSREFSILWASIYRWCSKMDATAYSPMSHCRNLLEEAAAIMTPSIYKTIIFQRDVCKLALRAEAPIFT